MTAIFVMSSQSSVPSAPAISPTLASAAGHLIAYAVLAVLVARALEFEVSNRHKQVGLAWCVSVVYGISDEIHQSFVPGRHATITDVVIDAIGAAVGLSLMLAYMRSNRQRRITT